MRTKKLAKIKVEQGKQELYIEREFDAPREVVFKAFIDPEIYAQWIGPRGLSTTLVTFEPGNGGSWKYIQKDANGNEFAFHGVNHEVLSPERIIGTFEFEGLPEKGHVILQTARFEELPGNRTKLTSQSVFQSVADRDGMLKSGMEEGVNDSYDRLDELLEKMQNRTYIKGGNYMQKIIPCLWFDNQAEEAANFYASIFKNSKIGNITRYGKEGYEIHGREAGTVMTVDFEIEGQKFTALNGGPVFKFNEAISFIVSCETQKEVDYYWDKLSEDGDLKSQQCGWLKDKYSISWQIVPEVMSKLVGDPTSEKSQRAMKAMLQMKKIDIEGLKKAYEGR